MKRITPEQFEEARARILKTTFEHLPAADGRGKEYGADTVTQTLEAEYGYQTFFSKGSNVGGIEAVGLHQRPSSE